MHGEFQKRMPGHSAGLHGFAKRVAQNDDPGYDDSDDSGSNLLLTGPVTITVTRTIEPETPMTTSTTTPMTVSSNDNNYESPYQSWTLVVPTTDTTPSNIPTSTQISLPLPSVGLGQSSNEGAVEPVSGSSTQKKLAPGVLTGVIILIIFLFFGVIIFVVRRRYVQRRIKMRKGWTRSKASQLKPNPSAYEPKGFSESFPLPLPTQPDMTATTTRPVTLVSLEIPGAPPASYGNEFSPSVTVKQSSSNSPIYGTPTAAPLSLSMATVVSTFITTLPDELSIMMGEYVRILAEYDDGWALCLNARGEQGMIPMECLDGRFATPSDEITISRGLGGNLRRVSSLQPNVGNIRRF